MIVTYGVFVGFIAFLRNEFKRINGTYTINNVRQLRADFGSYLLLGLEFLIASDILKTVVDPTLAELAILGGVVIVCLLYTSPSPRDSRAARMAD